MCVCVFFFFECLDFRVSLLKDAPNPVGILSTKAIGEPPLTLSCGYLLAIKHALADSRAEFGRTTHFDLNAPATLDAIQTAAALDIGDYVVS